MHWPTYGKYFPVGINKAAQYYLLFFHKQNKKWLYKLVFIYSWHWKRVTMWQSQRRSIVRALRGRVLHVLYLLKKTNNFYTVSLLHLCPLKLEVTHFSLFFSQTSRAPHIQPYHSQIQLASIVGFNFLPEPWKYLTDFIFTTSSSLIKQGKITLIETTFDWSDISTL